MDQALENSSPERRSPSGRLLHPIKEAERKFSTLPPYIKLETATFCSGQDSHTRAAVSVVFEESSGPALTVRSSAQPIADTEPLRP